MAVVVERSVKEKRMRERQARRDFLTSRGLHPNTASTESTEDEALEEDDGSSGAGLRRRW